MRYQDNRLLMWLPGPVLLLMLLAGGQAKPAVPAKPVITYVAGPSQLTLLHSQNAYRYEAARHVIKNVFRPKRQMTKSFVQDA